MLKLANLSATETFGPSTEVLKLKKLVSKQSILNLKLRKIISLLYKV